jgi:hypothetical protein
MPGEHKKHPEEAARGLNTGAELTASSPQRREALKSIARFATFVAPATIVLLDSKSASAAHPCSWYPPGHPHGC